MSSSRNKSKSSGLRILWIPGRKKNHQSRKGHYESTGKHVDYSRSGHNKQGKNEMWSLGGTKGHEDLIKTDISSGTEGSSAIAQILPASCAVAVGLQKDTDMKPEEESNKFQILETCNDEGKVQSCASPTECQNNKIDDNVKTLPINGNKIHKGLGSQNDINSIERIGENGEVEMYDGKSNLDFPDGSFHNFNKGNGKKKGKKKKKKNKDNGEQNGEETKDENEAAVKCLYYTLMCCECTIS